MGMVDSTHQMLALLLLIESFTTQSLCTLKTHDRLFPTHTPPRGTLNGLFTTTSINIRYYIVVRAMINNEKNIYLVLYAIFCDAFTTKVFDHAKITRWRRCTADSLKTLKANYMLIRILYVHRMTNMSVKFCFKIPIDC